eukprot:SAG22_NODE_16305_length_328_cov_1.310044_1_plen_41_part_01
MMNPAQQQQQVEMMKQHAATVVDSPAVTPNTSPMKPSGDPE